MMVGKQYVGTVTLQVSRHSWRCIDEDGTQCSWLRTSRFGSVWSCHIFGKRMDNGKWIPLDERDGCLARHPECLKASPE